MGLSATGAGYFSGLFTGVAESIWQGAIVIPKLLGEPEDFLEVGLGDALPQVYGRADLRVLGQVAVELRLVEMMQHVHDVRAADARGVVQPGVELEKVSKLLA